MSHIDSPSSTRHIHGLDPGTENDLFAGFFERVVRETLQRTDMRRGLWERIACEVDAISPEEMRLLNSQSRGVNKPTDILSFPTFEHRKEIVSSSGSVYIGEIVLCPEVIRADALKDDVSYKKEMAFVFSHGILHLLGYDHGEEMFALQDDVCENIGEGE